ncbi:hypothetical protein HYW53_03295 [Candidatus Giovannonibacteria bacterium]|nr:hypothetical protein [Candidatus Giovannonibacteria bacterium]
MIASRIRDRVYVFLGVLVGLASAVGISVFAATTISTSVTTGNDVLATSTVQATGTIFAYGDLLVGGTTTASVTGLSLAGDMYMSGGLGILNATTSDGDFAVGNDFFVFSNGIVSNGSTTPALAGTGVVSAGDAYFVGGVGVGDATTTNGALSVSGNARVSGNTQLGNSGKAINQVLFGTCTIDPPSLHDGAVKHVHCTDADGVNTTDTVFIAPMAGAGWDNNVAIIGASSTASGKINLIFKSTGTTTSIDIATTTVNWFAIQ